MVTVGEFFGCFGWYFEEIRVEWEAIFIEAEPAANLIDPCTTSSLSILSPNFERLEEEDKEIGIPSSCATRSKETERRDLFAEVGSFIFLFQKQTMKNLQNTTNR